MIPTTPRVSRKASSSSPIATIFFGGQSGSGSSSDSNTGNQNRRSSSPMAVPAPLSVRNLLSSARSIEGLRVLLLLSTKIDAAETRRQRGLFSRRWRARVVHHSFALENEG